MRRLSCVILVSAFFLAAASCAQRGVSADVPAPVGTVDPPDRVARIAYLQGSVSFQAAGTDEWAPAVLNRPLTSGDQMWTDNGSRAELGLASTAVRLDSQTNFGILNLDDRMLQAKITEGVASLRIRRLADEETIEVDTPNAAVTLLRPGEYRIEVHPEDNTTQVTVRAGDAEVTSTTQAFTVHARQQARIAGTDTATYEITAAGPQDPFDDFCASRDRRQEASASARYVSPDVVGYWELDAFGAWSVDPMWGPIWVPAGIAPGWAPYRFGHWVWIEPWGWTWIDDAPWGFAPFHYGRWLYLGARWAWIPGPIRVRPVYAPALVVFVGGGRSGFNYFFWIGSPGVAWFPLGPREVYVPPYHASRVYVNNINITNTVIAGGVNIDRIDMTKQRYANRNAPGGLTAVPRDAFTGGRRVSGAMANLTPQQTASARVNGTAAPVAPTRDSLMPSRVAGMPAPRPPQNVERRQVIVRQSPPPAPVPFERKQPALEARPGQPPDRGTLDGLRGSQPQARPEIRQLPPAVRAQPPVTQPRAQQPPAAQPRVVQPPPAQTRSAPEIRKEQRADQQRSRSIQNERQRTQPPQGKRR